ncbi:MULTISPECIES: hypothetical protein [Cyanophyceae]|uniref:hypothetical protein n=1 Tax=Cyanophyceae TaxID=3028117 RepID=UPI0016877E21|nr:MULTISPECIES: hypothetical protein [unclassified Trichocoleus]MBD1907445.1 hypothetical protein [Trichocoleus sp. FACHB-832]MBD2002856.1 hypothetical protein [Trichocoleus sp. FACHB-40]
MLELSHLLKKMMSIVPIPNLPPLKTPKLRSLSINLFFWKSSFVEPQSFSRNICYFEGRQA